MPDLKDVNAFELGVAHGRECASSVDYWAARRFLPGWSLQGVERYIEGRRVGAEEALGHPPLADTKEIKNISDQANQCPVCGHFVKGFFDHIAIDCEHDMSETEIAELLRVSEAENA